MQDLKSHRYDHQRCTLMTVNKYRIQCNSLKCFSSLSDDIFLLIFEVTQRFHPSFDRNLYYLTNRIFLAFLGLSSLFLQEYLWAQQT